MARVRIHICIAARLSCAGGTLIDSKARYLGKAGEISANAVLSGTISEIGGGKFANGNLNHLGIARAPSKSHLAYQNEHRSCAFIRECYYALLGYFGQQISFSGRKFRFKNPVYALDSTIITLCAEVYDWAHYTHAKGAVEK